MAGEAKRNRVGLVALVAACAAVTFFTLRLSRVFTTVWEHDVGILLDAAYRITSGQTAHLDFHTPLGAFTPAMISFGFQLAGQPSVLGIPYGCLVLALVIMPVSWFSTRHRIGPLEAAGFSLCLGFLVVAPRPIGLGDVSTFTYAMLYNRHGEALLGVFLLLLLFKPRRGRSELHGLTLAGFLLGVLFFLKLNYWVLGVLGLGVRLLLGWRQGDRSRVSQPAALLGGLLVGLCAMIVFTGASPGGYLADMASGLRAQEPKGRIRDLFRVASIAAGPLVVLLACTAGSALLLDRGQRSQALVVGAFFTGSGFVLAMSSYQESEMPIWSVGCLALLELTRRSLGEKNPKALSLLALFALTSFVPTTSRDIVVTWAAGGTPPSHCQVAWMGSPKDAPGLEGWVVATEAYRTYMDRGVRFVRRRKVDLEHTFVVDYFNPFPFAMGEPPARDTLVWWHLTRTVSENSYPEPESLFRETEFIMVPSKGLLPQTREFMINRYRQYWLKNFELVADEPGWKLFRRKAPSP